MPGEMSIKGEKVLEDGLKKLVNLFESEKEVLIAYLFRLLCERFETLQRVELLKTIQ